MSKIAFIYPGQGAQKAGMGRDFYENSPARRARDLYDQASQALGLDMKALCFAENDKLDLTEYTQAALVTTCLGHDGSFKRAGDHAGHYRRLKPGRIRCHRGGRRGWIPWTPSVWCGNEGS